MFKFWAGFMVATCLFTLTGALFPAPKKVDDRETLLYFRRIHDNIYNFPVVTTDPNGNRLGRRGDMVIYNNSGTLSIQVNNNDGPAGGTTWVDTGALS